MATDLSSMHVRMLLLSEESQRLMRHGNYLNRYICSIRMFRGSLGGIVMLNELWMSSVRP